MNEGLEKELVVRQTNCFQRWWTWNTDSLVANVKRTEMRGDSRYRQVEQKGWMSKSEEDAQKKKRKCQRKAEEMMKRSGKKTTEARLCEAPICRKARNWKESEERRNGKKERQRKKKALHGQDALVDRKGASNESDPAAMRLAPSKP